MRLKLAGIPIATHSVPSPTQGHMKSSIATIRLCVCVYLIQHGSYTGHVSVGSGPGCPTHLPL